MRFFADAALALRLLARDWRAGELTLVAVAVVVAVASVTTVGFFADRVHQALSRQANQLLGADLVISGDRALDASFAAEAERRGLKVAVNSSPISNGLATKRHAGTNSKGLNPVCRLTSCLTSAPMASATRGSASA